MCERDRQNFRSSSRGAADCAAAAVPLPQLRSQHCVVHLHREQLSVTPTQRCNFRGHIAQTFSEDKREPPALSGSAAKRLRVCVCVCVCVTLRLQEFVWFSSFTFVQVAHGSVPGVSQRSSRFKLGYREGTLSRRTCVQHTDTIGPPCCCYFLLSWWVMLHPPTLFPFPTALAAAR